MAVEEFSDAETSVFWDVGDFPNPNGPSFYEIIKSALEKEGYRGDVSIKAYGEKEPDENLDGVTDFILKRGKHARLNKMLVDIMFWALDHPKYPCVPRNLMVIAKNIPVVDTKFDEQLQVMATFEYNVLLVVAHDCAPEEAPLPRVRTIWIWESLLDGGEPLNSTERRSLLSRVKKIPFPSEHCLFEDDDIDCPCGGGIACPCGEDDDDDDIANKGHVATRRDLAPRPRSRKGKTSKRTLMIRSLIKEVAGLAPYEKRITELLKVGKDKRALKVAKRKLGTHKRAKRKREEMSSVLRK